MRIATILIGLAGICAPLASCVDYEAEPFTGQCLPRVTGYKTGVTDDWLYYNLATGETYNAAAPNRDIREGEQKTNEEVSMKWDLAFCGCKLRTNSGTSGIGMGGAADLGYGDYEKWTDKSQVEGLTFTPDDSSSVSIVYSTTEWTHHLTLLAQQGVIDYNDFDKYPWFDPNSGPQERLTSANPLLAEALVYSGPPPTYTPSFHTYCIRSADGERFYKLMIVSWYDADVEIGDEGGMVSFYLDEIK